jgi:anti-anti-sigma factor
MSFQPSTLRVGNRNEHLRCQRLLLAATIRPRRQEEFGDRPPTGTMTYALTISTAAGSTSVPIAGDLDYQTTDDLVEVASRLLARQNTMRDLHLDFSELTLLDSAALSGLLMLHRRTSRAGVALHLDDRRNSLTAFSR